MRQAYGFAAQMPADTDSYSAFYNLGKLWQDIKQSKTLASIEANPLFKQARNDPSFQQAIDQAHANPDAAKCIAILKDALGGEVFLAFTHGSAEKFNALLRLNNDIRMAQFRQALSGVNGPEASKDLMMALLSAAKDLEIPPVIIGFKVTSQKATLNEELAQAEKNLPPFVETGTFTLNGDQPFKSLAVTLGKAVPPEQQDEFKKMIESSMPDQQKADETFQALLARRVEVAYGYIGDYFIISIGVDHSHLKFAANYADSLLARPEVQKAADYTGKPVISFSWASAEMMQACRQEFQMMEYYQKLKDAIVPSLSPSDVEKLESDLKRIDAEWESAFKLTMTPAVGVGYRDHGLRGEVFGGVKRGAPAAAMKFSQVPTDSTFIWADSITDEAMTAAARKWLEDFSATAYDTFLRIGLPHLPAPQRPGFAIMQSLAVPKIVEFYKITRDQFEKGLGLEKAFAMDLNGEIPDAPQVPPQIHAGGKMMRLAVLSDVRDRALLNQSWDGYFKLANDVAQMTPAAIMFPKGLPKPETEVVDGVTLSYYKLPEPSGDVLPNVAVTDKAFVAGTSRSYSLELSKAASQPATQAVPLTLDLRVNLKPAYDFAEKWLALAGKNPELFFNGSEERAADFKKSEPDLAALLQSLRAFDGLSVRAYEENGVPRISSEIRWNEK